MLILLYEDELRRNTCRNTCRGIHLLHVTGFCTLSSVYLVTHVDKTVSYMHTHTQTHTERGTGLCEGTLGSSLLAKTLSSRPLAVQLGKMGVNRRHIVRFGH